MYEVLAFFPLTPDQTFNDYILIFNPTKMHPATEPMEGLENIRLSDYRFYIYRQT